MGYVDPAVQAAYDAATGRSGTASHGGGGGEEPVVTLLGPDLPQYDPWTEAPPWPKKKEKPYVPKDAPVGRKVDVAVLAAYPKDLLTAEQRKSVEAWEEEQRKPKPTKPGLWEGYDATSPSGLPMKVGLKPLAEGVMGMDFWKGFDVPVPGEKGGWTGKAKVGLKPLADSVRQQTGDLAGLIAEPLAELPSMELNVPRQFGGQNMDPVDVGMLGNVASGLPGTMASTGLDVGGEMLAQELEAAPLTALLGPAGALAGGAVRGAGQGVRAGARALGKEPLLDDAVNFFQHRGGMTDTSKERFMMNDLANNKADQLANDVREALTVAPSGRAYTIEEQQFLGQLLEQPGQREALARINDLPQDVSPAAQRALQASLRPVPGVLNQQTVNALRSAGLTEQDLPAVRKALGGQPTVGSLLDDIIETPGFDTPGQGKALMKKATENIVSNKVKNAAMRLPRSIKDQIKKDAYLPDGYGALPESDLSLGDFSRVANDVAKIAGTTGQDLAKTFGKDPVAWSRFTELNYNPRMYAGNKYGTFPTRGLREKTGFFKTREAQLDEARKMQGLITEPGGPMSMRLSAERRAINTRNLFNELASDPMVVTAPDPTDLTYMPEGTVRTINGVPYTKMADSDQLGPLRGMLVRTPEATDINFMMRRPGQGERIARDLWSAWKFGKTVMSPKTHIRNGMGNAMLAHAEGLSPYRVDIYAEALRDVRNGSGVFWKEAKDAGAGWTVKRGTALDEVISETALKDAESIYEAWARGVPKFMTQNKASTFMAEGYSDSEALFKQALYIFKRRNGLPIHQALQEADAAIINYANMPNWVKQSRSMPFTNGLPGVPFISFTYGATPILAAKLESNPRIFQHYKLFADSWNAVAAESAEATPEELRAIDTLYPGAFPMISPVRDAMGKLHIWDVARSTPVSQIPSMLDPLQVLMSNPMIGESVTQLSGYDPFRKAQVFPPVVPGADEAADFFGLSDDAAVDDILFSEPNRQRRQTRMEHIGRTVAPSPLGDILNIINADGSENMFGQKFTKEDAALAGLFGAPRTVNDDIARAGMKIRKQKEIAKQAQKKKARGD